MMYKIKILLITLTLVFPFLISAQCRGFSKKDCLPKLDHYIHTGQINSKKIKEGEKIEFMLTFYKGQEYRIIACYEDVFETVNLKVMDSKRRLIYENLSGKDLTFKFKVASTQQLIVSIYAPKSIKNESLEIEGCVSALVGFKF